jgi:multidrug efflux pump subunit AcrA (membrane-fusion protein)
VLEAERARLIAELQALSVLDIEPYLRSTQAGTIESLALAQGQAFSNEDGVAAQLVSLDSAQISLAIDELDIASVQEGQAVSITIDALEGESFSGSVTKVTLTGSVSGSVASYPAIVTFERTESVLVGMSATATIVKEQKDNVLTVPLVAVQEYGESVYVYTTVDEQGVLGGETLIETGLSDGSNVEIVSGLAEGATVYYRQQSSSSSDTMFNMRSAGNMAMPGGGESFAVGPGAGGAGGAATGAGGGAGGAQAPQQQGN